MNIRDWTNQRLIEISEKFSELIHHDPASFSCGYNVGYKQAILDLERFLVHEVTE